MVKELKDELSIRPFAELAAAFTPAAAEEPSDDLTSFAGPEAQCPESVREVLERYAPGRYEITEYSAHTVVLKPLVKHLIPSIPPSYYVKGGAARELLRYLLSNRTGYVRSRDVDLVRFKGTSDVRDHELSLQFMADDYEYGRGVEVVEDRETYFKTRDITQNESLYGLGLLEVSHTAVLDMQQGIIRPTAFVTNAEGAVLSATIMKALRFAAFAQVQRLPVELKNIPAGSEVRPFDAALNLERSLQQGTPVAEEYLWLAWERSFLYWRPGTPPSLAEAIVNLSNGIKQGISLFKSIPREVLLEVAALNR